MTQKYKNVTIWVDNYYYCLISARRRQLFFAGHWLVPKFLYFCNLKIKIQNESKKVQIQREASALEIENEKHNIMKPFIALLVKTL